MLGLDGSFVFLEHVFWVVSLNTLFILLFAYIPHQLGKVVLSSFLTRNEQNSNFFHFEGAINTVFGEIYFVVMKATSLKLRILHVWLYVHGITHCQRSDEHGQAEQNGKIDLYLYKGEF